MYAVHGRCVMPKCCLSNNESILRDALCEARCHRDNAIADAKHAQDAVIGLRRRIDQTLGAHSDDWTYWRNAMQQALRWLDEHDKRKP